MFIIQIACENQDTDTLYIMYNILQNEKQQINYALKSQFA